MEVLVAQPLESRQDDSPAGVSERQTWSAVGSTALCVTLLVASGFMPVSLLTPIARDLRATEGMAGQAISISGLLAVVTSLFIATVAGRFDRRPVLLTLTALMAASLIVIAEAQSFAVLMVARAVRIPAGVKHWHGASPTAAMSHIAIQESRNGSPVTWLEKVSDEQYRR